MIRETAIRHLIDEKIYPFIGLEGLVILAILKAEEKVAHQPWKMLDKNQAKHICDERIHLALEELKENLIELRKNRELSLRARKKTIEVLVNQTLRLTDLGSKAQFLKIALTQLNSHVLLHQQFPPI